MPLDSGIWRYTEGETASPTFSELLNRLGDSVRTRFATLDTGWVNVTLAAGFTFGVQPQVRRVGQTVYWRGNVTCTAGWTTSYQNVVPAANLPGWAMTGSGVASESNLQTGSVIHQAIGRVDSGNGLRVAASLPGVTVALKGLSGYLVD